MAIVNKVTELRPLPEFPVNLENIQTHIDNENNDGWSLVSAVDQVGWYRFFWAKEVD